ncbi:MAG: isoamylase early set domain-containing protein [Elusimicrobiota bacterium]
MSCKKAVEIINKKMDYDRVSTADLEFLSEHTQKCRVCKEKYEFYAKLDNLNEYAGKIAVPETFTSKVLVKTRNVTDSSEYEIKHSIFDSLRLARINILSLTAAIIMIATIPVAIYHFTVAQPTAQQVWLKFDLPAPENASTVSLVGDFNNWDEKSGQMIRSNGNWTIIVPLQPKCYKYMFVIDGKKYMSDPKSKNVIEDNDGRKKSVIDLSKSI